MFITYKVNTPAHLTLFHTWLPLTFPACPEGILFDKTKPSTVLVDYILIRLYISRKASLFAPVLTKYLNPTYSFTIIYVTVKKYMCLINKVIN